VTTAPKQARSVASMNRMLDTAESLLDRGGPDALTVDAVVRAAATSTGSFYARFGDRQGLLIAMQDRLLDRLSASLARTFDSSSADEDLARIVERLVADFLDAFSTNRQAFVAFMILNRSEPAMRDRGAEASRGAAQAIAHMLERHEHEITHPDPQLAADFVFRTLFALATQTVMFDDHEISDRRYTASVRGQETTAMLLGYLRTEQSSAPVSQSG
jgi:AcrR family transcriptional regulator